MEEPKFHVRTYYVNGLNIGKTSFIWNDKLLFRDGGSEYGNIAEVHIFIDRPIPEVNNKFDELHSVREGNLIIGIFLACFRLVNKNLELILDQSDISSYSVYDIEDFKSGNYITIHNNTEVDLPKHPEENCKKYLTDTIPLFEKVIKKIDLKQKQQKNPLSIALPRFQRIEDENIESIIDYVTVLESLVCENEGELKFKFALRISLLVEKDSRERRSTFEALKEIYNYRSKLVHGSEIPLDLYDDDNYGIILWLQKITGNALLEYIELVYSGLSKKEIIAKLDTMALGISDDQ